MDNQRACEIGLIDDNGVENPLDTFPNSFSAYAWAIKQSGHVYYKDTKGQRFAFRDGRIDIDFFNPA